MKSKLPGLKSIMEFEPKLARLRKRYEVVQSTGSEFNFSKVSIIKRMIRNGTYDVDGKLNAILDELLK